MRPLRIEIEGLRSFRDQQVIDLEGRDHVAIIGDTGAGKSSLLEAITWALFGRTTFTGQANQELMNDTSTATRVTVRFVVAGDTWEVTRLLRRAGDGTVTGARATLFKLDADGEPVEQVERVRGVNDRIEQVLGLDFDAFVRTVLLPQGQFAQLLVADSPSDRAAILRQVWRTDEIEAVGDAARQTLAELRPLHATATERLAGEPDDPDAHLAALQHTAEQATARQRQTAEQAKAATQAVATLAGAKLALEAADTAAALDDVDLTDAKATATTIAETDAKIAGELAEHEKAGNAAKTALAKLPADDADGLDVAQLATVRNLVDRAVEQADTARDAAVDAVDAAKDATDAQEQATKAAEAAELAADATAADRETRTTLTEAAEQARSRHADATSALGQLRTAIQTASTAKGKAVDAAEAVTQLEEAAAGAADAAQTAQQDAEEAAVERDRLQRHNAAATAAAGLTAGDDCPICGEPLPTGWTPPSAPELDAATERAANLQDAASAARDEVTAATTRLDNARTAADTAKQDAETADGDVVTATGTLAELLDVAVDAIGEELDDRLLGGLAEERDAAADAVVTHDEQARDRTAAAASTATAAQTAKRDAANAATAATTAADTAAAARKTLDDTLAGLPAGIDGLDDLGEADAGRLPDVVGSWAEQTRATLAERAATLNERAETRRDLQTRLDAARDDHRAATSRRNEQVTGPAAALASTLDEVRDRLRTATEALARHIDQPPSTPPPAGNVAPADLPGHVEQLAASVTATVAAGEQLRTDTGRTTADADDTITQLTTDLDLAPDTPPAAVAEQAQRVATLQQRTAADATTAADQFGQRLEPLKTLQEAAADLDATLKVVDDIAKACNPGAFPKWLTIRRSHALLVAASGLLGEMTGGRYAFADVTDDTSSWEIVDNDSGLPRSPASLSGGEKFMASLSLALGMVEMMARAGGRLESLWLDEGFGALDRTNLDAAVEALASAATGGRLVAVISHVAAVAEQIDNVLAVARTATGTQIRWLTPAEKAGFATDDLGGELAGAVSGLLT